MSDIIDNIDRLYVKAEKANAGGPPAAYEAAMLELHSALVGNWPALRDRLREAERRLALAEKALEVKEQLNETLRRCCDEAKAKELAFDAIANRSVGIVSDSNSDDLVIWRAWSFSPLPPSNVADGRGLLTAIEQATREAQP